MVTVVMIDSNYPELYLLDTRMITNPCQDIDAFVPIFPDRKIARFLIDDGITARFYPMHRVLTRFKPPMISSIGRTFPECNLFDRISSATQRE